MAKKATSKKAERKPPAPGSTRRITHKTIMDGVEGGGRYKVFGIAKKVIVQDTVFAKIPGLKGTFEAITPKGETLTSKRCFLPLELHGDVASKMKEAGDGEVGLKQEVAFGAEVIVNADDSTKSGFFAEPHQTDLMANLREQANA